MLEKTEREADEEAGKDCPATPLAIANINETSAVLWLDIKKWFLQLHHVILIWWSLRLSINHELVWCFNCILINRKSFLNYRSTANATTDARHK